MARSRGGSVRREAEEGLRWSAVREWELLQGSCSRGARAELLMLHRGGRSRSVTVKQLQDLCSLLNLTRAALAVVLE